VACLSVVGSSMVASATDQLDKTVGTDFIIQEDHGQVINPQAVKAIKAPKTAGNKIREGALETWENMGTPMVGLL